jgi:hypothetical protein
VSSSGGVDYTAERRKTERKNVYITGGPPQRREEVYFREMLIIFF